MILFSYTNHIIVSVVDNGVMLGTCYYITILFLYQPPHAIKTYARQVSMIPCFSNYEISVFIKTSQLCYGVLIEFGLMRDDKLTDRLVSMVCYLRNGILNF